MELPIRLRASFSTVARPLNRIVAILFAPSLVSAAPQDAGGGGSHAPYGEHAVTDCFQLSEGDSGRSLSIDLECVDRILEDLRRHAYYHPGDFATEEQRSRAGREAGHLAELLGVIAEREGTALEVLIRYAEANAHSYNLDVHGAGERAQAAYERVLERDPDSGWAHFLYGQFLTSTSTLFPRGVEHFSRSAELGFDYALLRLGETQLALGRDRAARESLEAYLERFPDDAAARSMLGAMEDLALAVQGSDGEVLFPADSEVTEAINAAVAYLLEHQEVYEPDPRVGRLPDDQLEAWQEGERERLATARARAGAGEEWPYEGVYRVGPEGTIPAGYRVGGTAIVCLALLEAPGWSADKERRAATLRAARFMLDRIERDPEMAPGPKEGYDVRGWGHVYALRFFLRGLDRGVFEPELRRHIHEAVPHLVHCIEVNEEPGGGWNYAGGRTSPFMTASTLIALFHANARGYEVNAEMVERALDSLERGRTEAGSFAYAGVATGEVPMPGSSARSAAAELCLFRAGRSDGQRLRAAVAGFFEGWGDLLERKSRQGTHEGPYGIAPYYFFYGHTYAALALAHLGDDATWVDHKQLLGLLWRTREADGSWNDRIFPRTGSFSTAMVVLALLAPELPEVEEWPGHRDR